CWVILPKWAIYDHPMCKLPGCCRATMPSVPKGGVRARRRVRPALWGGGDRQPRGPSEPCRFAAHLILACTWLALAAGHGSAEASWLAKVTVLAERGAGKLGSGELERAARYLRSVAPDGRAALAAQATQEGHWIFVNRAGETMTAATPQELTRVAAILLPEAKADVKLTLYVTEDTVFEFRAALKDLTKGNEIF